MSTTAVNFHIYPPYQKVSTAKNKIFALADRPWGETVTLIAIAALFHHYLDRIVADAVKIDDQASLGKKCALSVPLKKIVSLLCLKYSSSKEWKVVQHLALRALGAAHTLEALATQRNIDHRLANMPKDVLIRVFLNIIEKNHVNLRRVSRHWKVCADEANNIYSERRWVNFCLSHSDQALDHMRTIHLVNPRCRFLGLLNVDAKLIPSFLSKYSRLEGLVLHYDNDFMTNVAFFCPQLTELKTFDNFSGGKELSFTSLRHLRTVELHYVQKEVIHFPDSIQSISIVYALSFQSSLFSIPDTAVVRNLSIEDCDIDGTLDLTAPCWSQLETLALYRCTELDAIRLPPICEKLRTIEIIGCESIHHLDLSEIYLPVLEKLVVEIIEGVVLPKPAYAPKLGKLVLTYVDRSVDLRLVNYSALRNVHLNGLLVERLSLPSLIEKCFIQDSSFEQTDILEKMGKLKYFNCLMASGMQEVLSLEDSNELEECHVDGVIGISKLILPRNLSFMRFCSVIVEDPMTIVGMNGEWNQLIEMCLSGGPLFGFEGLDFTDSRFLQTLYIDGSPHLWQVRLPEESETLQDLELSGVGLHEVDVSRFSALENFVVRSEVNCKVTLGGHPLLKDPEFSENVTVNEGVKKKRRKG